MIEKHALIVEDTADLALIFSDILTASGFVCDIAEDGAVALDKLSQSIPDVVILDLHLPEVSGDRVLKHIRATDALKDLKVIVVTADGSGGMQLVDDADMVLMKPVSPAEFSRLVTRITR